MHNSYSGEDVEQAERQTATTHMVSYGIRKAYGCVTCSGVSEVCSQTDTGPAAGL